MILKQSAARVITLVCAVCGQGFRYVTKLRGRRPRFCSAGCKARRNSRHRRIKTPDNCKTCGKVFHRFYIPRRQSFLAMAHTVHAVVVLRMLSGLRLQGMSGVSNSQASRLGGGPAYRPSSPPPLPHDI